MNIHEYQGKQLFKKHGIPVPQDLCPDQPETVNDFEDGIFERHPELRPEVVAVEDCFTYRNARSALALAQARLGGRHRSRSVGSDHRGGPRVPPSELMAGPRYAGLIVFAAAGSTRGIGLVLTLGGGNDLVCQAIEQIGAPLVGREIDEAMAEGLMTMAEHGQAVVRREQAVRSRHVLHDDGGRAGDVPADVVDDGTGVEFEGIGRLDTGELAGATAIASAAPSEVAYSSLSMILRAKRSITTKSTSRMVAGSVSRMADSISAGWTTRIGCCWARPGRDVHGRRSRTGCWNRSGATRSRGGVASMSLSVTASKSRQPKMFVKTPPSPSHAR